MTKEEYLKSHAKEIKQLQELLSDVLKPESLEQPYFSNFIMRILGIIDIAVKEQDERKEKARDKA